MPQLHDENNHAADKILVTTILTREEEIKGVMLKKNNELNKIFCFNVRVATAYHNHFDPK